MIELLIISVILNLILLGTAGFLFADARNKRETIEYFKSELPLWQQAGLRAAGKLPLGIENQPKKQPDLGGEITPRVVHRAQLQNRAVPKAEQAPANEMPIPNIYASGVSYSRVARKETVEKAAEIIEANR